MDILQKYMLYCHSVVLKNGPKWIIGGFCLKDRQKQIASGFHEYIVSTFSVCMQNTSTQTCNYIPMLIEDWW